MIPLFDYFIVLIHKGFTDLPSGDYITITEHRFVHTCFYECFHGMLGFPENLLCSIILFSKQGVVCSKRKNKFSYYYYCYKLWSTHALFCAPLGLRNRGVRSRHQGTPASVFLDPLGVGPIPLFISFYNIPFTIFLISCML